MAISEPEITDDNWRKYAACRERDPEDFFPDDLRLQRIAARFCNMMCAPEVKGRCLQGAIREGSDKGVRGGTTERERGKLPKTWTYQ